MNSIKGHVDYSGCGPAPKVMVLPEPGYTSRSHDQRGREWSDEEKQILRTLWPYNNSSDIGARLGRTKNAIAHMASIIGLGAK